VLFGWDAEQATGFERDAIDRRRVSVIEAGELGADPEDAAKRARALVEDRSDRLLVHFDVDVIDFTDVPLSENWGRNVGIAYADALRALTVLLDSPKLAGLTITELNPDHAEEGAGSVDRFASDVAKALALRRG
jgi:arginase